MVNSAFTIATPTDAVEWGLVIEEATGVIVKERPIAVRRPVEKEKEEREGGLTFSGGLSLPSIGGGCGLPWHYSTYRAVIVPATAGRPVVSRPHNATTVTLTRTRFFHRRLLSCMVLTVWTHVRVPIGSMTNFPSYHACAS